MANIHKRSLINKIAKQFNDSQENTKKIIDCFTAQMLETLKSGNDLELRGFGVFRIKERGSRKGINPKTQEKVDVPPKKHIHFKMGSLMREAISKGQ
jgi:nucleoid DNA-binding protein